MEASDLNPVAVLILKCTVEYPQKFGQPDSRPVPDYILNSANDGLQSSYTDGSLAEAYRRNPLATDVRYWGNWILERARKPQSTEGGRLVSILKWPEGAPLNLG